MRNQPGSCCTAQSIEFGSGEGLFWSGERPCFSTLYLHKMERVALAGHDVEFVATRPPVAVQNTKTLCLQIIGCRLFASVAH